MNSTADILPKWSDDELRSKVGQLFIVGFKGHVPSEDIKTLLTTYKVGSVILFSRNIESGLQLLELTNSLQDISRSAGQKQGLFISIDQENGLITRIKPPVATQLPGSMALGATKDPSSAYKIAAATAETLKAFGINMNYAPIADVNSEPKNPVIGVRSPSDDPETVARFVSAQFKGLRDGGVVPCVKHFPGHGDTAVDSHFGLPIISKTIDEMETCELVPFRRAVAEGVDAVMTAHIVMSGLGEPNTDTTESKNLPASLNPRIIKILRREMGYCGLVVSDCLEMEGVRGPYGTERAAVMALKAGTDCVMICHTITSQIGAIQQVIEAVKSGELSQSTIQASVDRVEALKTKYSVSSATQVSLLEAKSRNERQSALASRIYGKSTTVVRSEVGVLPLKSGEELKIVLLRPGKGPKPGGCVEENDNEDVKDPYTAAAYIDVIRIYNPNSIEVQYQEETRFSEESQELIDEADYVILATINASLSEHQRKFGLSLGKRLGLKLVVVATSDPYDFLNETDEVKNYIAIYEPTVAAFKSAVNVIFGTAIPTGSLPVANPTVKHAIESFKGAEVEPVVDRVWYMWQYIFPKWPIERIRLLRYLKFPHSRLFTHEKGFCLAYFVECRHVQIAIIGVLPNSRGQGIGTTLIKTTHSQMKTEDDMRRDLRGFSIGSCFPRIWPGVPIDFEQEYKDFFLHRGFRKIKSGEEPGTVRDYYRDITGEIASPDMIERILKLPVSFAPLPPEHSKECLTGQQVNFPVSIGKVQNYELLINSIRHHEIMVAFDESGHQVAWTMMCSQTSIVSELYAFLPLMPAKEKTGLIAFVGVKPGMRGKGIGLGLVVKAMENMKTRGIEGVFIDHVEIRGFYEKLGFESVCESERYEWS